VTNEDLTLLHSANVLSASSYDEHNFCAGLRRMEVAEVVGLPV